MAGRSNRKWELGAVERIQKAKRAKNVKRFARHKQRTRLFEELEESSESAVIVAPELGLPGDREDALEQELLKQASVHEHTKKGNETKIHEDNYNLEQPCANDPSAPERNSDMVSGSGSNPSRRETGKDDAGGQKTVQRNRFPFQKEIKLREAARLEREKERQRIKEETEAYHRRRDESRKARKKGGKRFRKMTRRGQPVLKHRIDTLLKDIQKK